MDITIVCVYGEVKKPKIKSLNTIENQIKDDEDAERKKKKENQKKKKKKQKKKHRSWKKKGRQAGKQAVTLHSTSARVARSLVFFTHRPAGALGTVEFFFFFFFYNCFSNNRIA